MSVHPLYVVYVRVNNGQKSFKDFIRVRRVRVNSHMLMAYRCGKWTKVTVTDLLSGDAMSVGRAAGQDGEEKSVLADMFILAGAAIVNERKKVMIKKSVKKYEKRIQELIGQCQRKTNECYQAWINEQLEKVHIELDNKLFQTSSLVAMNMTRRTSRFCSSLLLLRFEERKLLIVHFEIGSGRRKHAVLLKATKYFLAAMEDLMSKGIQNDDEGLLIYVFRTTVPMFILNAAYDSCKLVLAATPKGPLHVCLLFFCPDLQHSRLVSLTGAPLRLKPVIPAKNGYSGDERLMKLEGLVIATRDRMMVVVDAQFIEPFTVNLAVQRKSAVANSSGNFTIIDVNGNMMFKIKDTLFSFHDRHILYDAKDKPVLTFKKKLRSIHGRWQAFKGESTTHKDLLFSVKKSSTPKHETELDVFLVENKEETECDCKVIGNWETKSCTIYAQDGFTALAEVHDKQNITNVVHGKDTFGITVYPEVDYVFIVALVVILTEIKSYDGIGKKKKKTKKNTQKKSSDSSDEDNKNDNLKSDEEIKIPEGKKELEEDYADDEQEDYEEDEEEDDEDDSDDDKHNEDEDNCNNESYEGEPKYDEYEDDDESSSTEDEIPRKV
ncbi:hypothetical protein L1987_20388 [Smallanthus sonchifolius]|uniref:Uncharacterized protein n=1 Tax=Smallanthus sonchifolius TaxID=185202 RepID=A0ACB9ITK0_9ASTR|nr:hypothetical protein L1987_20388 [Smallanthus sonchifolius]